MASTVNINIKVTIKVEKIKDEFKGDQQEPHYSVPRNNSRVSDCLHVGPGDHQIEAHQQQHNQHRQDHHQHHQDHHQADIHRKPEAEVDKTPTNEAGRMLDILEKVQ